MLEPGGKATLGDLLDAGLIEATVGFPFGGHNDTNEGIPHIRPFNVRPDAEISLDQIKSIPNEAALGKPRLARNDIVFNNTNTKQLVGKCALWEADEAYVFSNHMTRLRAVDSTIVPAYISFSIFYHWLIGRSEMLARAHVAQASIMGERFREIEIIWREKDEQRQISDLLRIVLRARQLQELQIETTNRLKRAAMRELFTRGLRGEAQKKTEIGLVPESWKPRTILDLCEILSGGTPRKSITHHWSGPIPWASGKDLKVPTLHDTIDHISDEGLQAGSRLAPLDAVFVLVRGMGLAKDLPISVISRPMAFNQDLKALVSRGEVSGAYIRSAIYFAKDRLLSRIVPSAHGTMTLNLDDIETFKIACPPNKIEADEIVTVLEAIDRKSDLHKKKRLVLEDLFETLLHKLMTGEIRVGDLDLTVLTSPAQAEAAA